MKPWFLLLVGTFCLVQGQRIVTVRRIPMTYTGPSCEEKCDLAYSKAKAEGSPNLIKSCETGCRLLNLIDTAGSSPFVTTDAEKKQSLDNCHGSCSESYKAGGDREACDKGCQYEVPIAKERKNSIQKALDQFFGGPNIDIANPPKIDINPQQPQPPSPFGGLNDFFNSMPSFNSMFDSMHKQMNEVMNKLMNSEDGEIPKNGNGRMVVIKSGPGYHSEKTVDFGPDGVKTQVKTTGNQAMDNDMMSKMNPIEKFFNKNMVDLFTPKNSNTKEIEESQLDSEKEEVEIQEDKNRNLDILDDFRNSVPGFDFEEPRLPEEGLKPRLVLYPNQRHMQLICSQNGENMRWSDWVSCLHMRMGLPRWLTAATISLGIVFIIWLCLVIPHNAPKQRVKITTKAMEAAGQLEKDKTLSLVMANPVKLDLPPAYDDIANLHVAVPVIAENEEAGPLPKKEELSDKDKKDEMA